MAARSSKPIKEFPSIQYHNPFFMYLLIWVAVLALTACALKPVQMVPVTPTIAPTVVPTVRPALDPSIKRASDYLKHELNRELGLLRESPKIAHHKHWLMTDNWLAANGLGIVGEAEFASRLCTQIKKYNPPRHGLIEALAGEDIKWPPKAPVQPTVMPGIWREERSGNVMKDWKEYSDLALYGALDEYNEGNLIESRKLYTEAIGSFHGVGFADKVFDIEHTYTTYKLALAVYVASLIGEPVDEKILEALLNKQQPSGGFITLYDKDGKLLNPESVDTNTETTAYALLALSSLKLDDKLTFSCELPAHK